MKRMYVVGLFSILLEDDEEEESRVDILIDKKCAELSTGYIVSARISASTTQHLELPQHLEPPQHPTTIQQCHGEEGSK